MNRWGCALVGLVVALSSWAQSEVRYVWEGMHRSDALSNGFLGTFAVGGVLDPVELEGIRHRMVRSGAGHLGVVAGHALQGRGGGEDHVARVELASRGVLSATASEGVFGLVFQGNAPDLGERKEWAPTGVKWMQWNRLAFGLGNADGSSFVDVGIYHAALGADAELVSGGVFVSSTVDSLAFDVAGRADFWEHAGWGLGFDVRHQWGEEGRWWAIGLEDVAVVRYGSGERAVADTGLATTGLPWQGAGWTVEGVQAEGFGEGLISRRVVGEGWQVLPTRVAVSGGRAWGKQCSGVAELAWGGWMPRPRLEVGVMWRPSAAWAIELGGIVGGWGTVRPVMGVVRNRQLGSWSLRWDDPVGSVRSQGRGRGVALAWSRNLGE